MSKPRDFTAKRHSSISHTIRMAAPDDLTSSRNGTKAILCTFVRELFCNLLVTSIKMDRLIRFTVYSL